MSEFESRLNELIVKAESEPLNQKIVTFAMIGELVFSHYRGGDETSSGRDTRATGGFRMPSPLKE